MHIVQIAPEIAPGSGVAMVAFALEHEFDRGGRAQSSDSLSKTRGVALHPRTARGSDTPGTSCGSARSAPRARSASWPNARMPSPSATTMR